MIAHIFRFTASHLPVRGSACAMPIGALSATSRKRASLWSRASAARYLSRADRSSCCRQTNPNPAPVGEKREAHQRHQHPQPFAERRIDFRGVHAGDQGPGRIGHDAHRGHHRHPAVVDTFFDSLLPECRLHRGQVRVGQGLSQSEGRVLLEPELVQEQDVVAVPAHEKRLGRAAGAGPTLQEGIEIPLGIDPQDEHAQGARVVGFARGWAPGPPGGWARPGRPGGSPGDSPALTAGPREHPATR